MLFNTVTIFLNSMQQQCMQMQQTELEKSSRWFAGTGCVFTEDFIRKHVGVERMKTIDMMGAYIYKAEKPMPCIFVCFGAGGAWIPNVPITKHITINRTEAESSRMGTFMYEIDPENKYHIRTWYFHLDLTEAKMIRRPTDDEIAKLQLKYRDSKKYCVTPKNRRAAMLAATKRAEPDRLVKEIRALDRRRYTDAGIIPPPERANDVRYLALIKGEPRKLHKIGKHKLDDYHSDTSDDEQKPWNWSPSDDVRKRHLESLSLFGEDEEDEVVEREEDETELGDCLFDDKDDSTAAPPPVQKRPRQASASGKSGTTTLERVLRAMRAQSRQKHRPL